MQGLCAGLTRAGSVWRSDHCTTTCGALTIRAACHGRCKAHGFVSNDRCLSSVCRRQLCRPLPSRARVVHFHPRPHPRPRPPRPPHRGLPAGIPGKPLAMTTGIGRGARSQTRVLHLRTRSEYRSGGLGRRRPNPSSSWPALQYAVL